MGHFFFGKVSQKVKQQTLDIVGLYKSLYMNRVYDPGKLHHSFLLAGSNEILSEIETVVFS